MRSMTGYGQASWQGRGLRIAVEVRSVNQRFLDVRLNLPREYQQWEDELKEVVQEAVERGRVDIVISRTGTLAGDFVVEVNEPLARATVNAWRDIQNRLKLGGSVDLSILVGRPELVRVVERRRDATGELSRVRQLMVKALREFNRCREREGASLARDMRARAAKLRRIEKRLCRRTEELVPELQRRLAQRVRALLGDQTLNEERLIQEAAFLAERADVTEELVRLRSHLDRLTGLLKQRGSVGKAIDFLVQELHREINTIASKSADIEVTNLTLEAKGEIEKLREQVQNVE